MKAKMTFQVTFDLRPAKGPNPKNYEFEVVDEDGMRIAYFNDLNDAEDWMLEYCDESLMLDGKVTTVVTGSSKWHDNSIQFPRLLCEIASSQEISLEDLACQMELSPNEVRQLFDRAEVEWQKITASLGRHE